MTATLTRPPPSTTAARPRAVVTLTGLTKRYGDRTVVDHLDVAIPPGVIAGFVGPNGAGKTTTLGMLLGLIRPSEGTGTVLGHPLDQPAAYLGDVGALIEGPAFYPGLSAQRNLAVLAAAAGLETSSIPEVLDLVGLGARAGDPYGSYSLGMKQRLGIAGALLGDPKLLILDEPINGLDPAGIREMRQLIGRVGHAERTVLVSSHVLAELEQTCDWLVMIDHGALVFQGPATELLDHSVTGVRVVPERVGDLRRLRDLLDLGGCPLEEGDGHLVVTVGDADPRALAAEVNRQAMDAGLVLAELSPQRTSLEDRYLTMVTGGDR